MMEASIRAYLKCQRERVLFSQTEKPFTRTIKVEAKLIHKNRIPNELMFLEWAGATTFKNNWNDSNANYSFFGSIWIFVEKNVGIKTFKQIHSLTKFGLLIFCFKEGHKLKPKPSVIITIQNYFHFRMLQLYAYYAEQNISR